MPNPNVIGGNGFVMNAQQTNANPSMMQQPTPPLTQTNYTLIIVNRYEEAAVCQEERSQRNPVPDASIRLH